MRNLVVAAVVLAVAAGLWWYASPLWTLYEMRAAARSRDADKLSQYVDYDALREDLKGEVRRSIAAKAAPDSSGMGTLGSAVAGALAGPLIDAMVTPEAVEAMFTQVKRRDARAPSIPVKVSADPIIERDGFNRFRVRDKDRSKGSVVFRRSGFGWKLVGVDLPSG